MLCLMRRPRMSVIQGYSLRKLQRLADGGITIKRIPPQASGLPIVTPGTTPSHKSFEHLHESEQGSELTIF